MFVPKAFWCALSSTGGEVHLLVLLLNATLRTLTLTAKKIFSHLQISSNDPAGPASYTNLCIAS
jgi:hypothetical protein